MINVVKRNGDIEPLEVKKLAQLIQWSGEGLDVSESEVEMKTQIQFFDGMLTSDIHDIVVKAAADLISSSKPDYAKQSARLLLYKIRKVAYGNFDPPALGQHIRKMVDLGKYDKHLVKDFSQSELYKLDRYIDHDRDLDFAYAGMVQMEQKYLCQDRTTKTLYESPQMAYMCIAMCLHAHEPKRKRMKYIMEFYDAISTFRISLPTPIMSGVRTPTRQFSSCVLIETGDSLPSICKSANSIIKYVSQRAGIGLNAGAIRAVGSRIRNGEAFHTGCIPFYKHFQTAVKSCSQGGVRGGAATVFYPLWHLEVEGLLILKNNKGIDENRVRHMDYGVQFNRLMYQRLIDDDVITLFSPSDVPGLYEAFFADQDKFQELYEAAELDDSIRKERIPAAKLFSLFFTERANTGRIYAQNVDHCNVNGPFIESQAPIRQSNLCVEVALPTKPMGSRDEEIALCTLAAFNLGAKDLDFARDAKIIVRALDNLLDYQDYPVKAAEKNKMRRTLGVGVINYAYWLASQGLKYSDGSGNHRTHELFEEMQYQLLAASCELAQEKGPCEWFHETKYSQGILPIDRYKEDVDDLVKGCSLKMDWDLLRAAINKHGLRNSTLSALMPSETSSQISNATNGIEPPRGLVSVKASKDGILKQVVPAIGEVVYELLWDIPDNKGYLQLVGIMQKFMDQSISANTNYDPSKFEGGRVPLRLFIEDMLLAYKYGLKTMYYHNTRDGAGEAEDEVIETIDEGCEGGACKL